MGGRGEWLERGREDEGELLLKHLRAVLDVCEEGARWWRILRGESWFEVSWELILGR